MSTQTLMISEYDRSGRAAGPAKKNLSRPGAVLLTLLLLNLTAAPELSAQAESAGPEFKFEVLNVTTGSGTKINAREQPELKIETVKVAANSEARAPGGDGAFGPMAQAAPAKGKSQPGAKAAPASKAGGDFDKAALVRALEQWHTRTLASYRYDIPRLSDPFMPIKEVRGTPEEEIDLSSLSLRPRIEQFELNQLKMVAIVMRGGAGLVAFEDGAGASYMLRVGDRIGRNHGVITKIEDTEILVVERGFNGTDPPKPVVIKLNVTSTQGLSRAGQETPAQPTPAEVQTP